MTRVSPISTPSVSKPFAKLFRTSVLSLGVCALMATLVGCGRDTTRAEPDPAKVSVEINPGKPGLNKPLALPQENKDDSKAAPIVAEPVTGRAAKAAHEEPASDGSKDTKPASAELGNAADTKPADVKQPAPAGEPLKVKRLVVTTSIEKREPVEVSSFEAKSGPIYAFMELENPADVDQDVMLTFVHSSGRKVGLVELHIPAKQQRWRTWGRTKNIKQGGDWEAVITSADGQELGRTKFHVEATKSAPEKAQPAHASKGPEATAK